MFEISAKQDEKWESYCHYLIFRFFPAAGPKCPNSPILKISHVCPLYGQFHSFAEAYKLLFQSLGDKSTDNIKWYWFTHPKQNRSLLIFVWNVPGQLIWSEMSKFARLRGLMIPAITLILHLNSCTNVFFCFISIQLAHHQLNKLFLF